MCDEMGQGELAVGSAEPVCARSYGELAVAVNHCGGFQPELRSHAGKQRQVGYPLFAAVPADDAAQHPVRLAQRRQTSQTRRAVGVRVRRCPLFVERGRNQRELVTLPDPRLPGGAGRHRFEHPDADGGHVKPVGNETYGQVVEATAPDGVRRRNCYQQSRAAGIFQQTSGCIRLTSRHRDRALPGDIDSAAGDANSGAPLHDCQSEAQAGSLEMNHGLEAALYAAGI